MTLLALFANEVQEQWLNQFDPACCSETMRGHGCTDLPLEALGFTMIHAGVGSKDSRRLGTKSLDNADAVNMCQHEIRCQTSQNASKLEETLHRL